MGKFAGLGYIYMIGCGLESSAGQEKRGEWGDGCGMRNFDPMRDAGLGSGKRERAMMDAGAA
jgi:hypothetical protein